MHYFCTYCDQGYVARLLCLRQSLIDQKEPFRLAVLCFDEATLLVVRSLEGDELCGIALDEFLSCHPEYASSCEGRSRVERYFTATPVLICHCFDLFVEADAIAYVDSDLYFFGAASLVFEAQAAADIAIVPHRFPGRLRHLEKCGIYNVGWVSFRRSQVGLDCVEWWKERCLEWCYDRVEGGNYADQGYLDAMPRQFGSVAIVSHRGVNLAPWNVEDVSIRRDGIRILVDEVPLLCYHFQGFREVIPSWFDLGINSYGVKLSVAMLDLIYKPYMDAYVYNSWMLKRRFDIASQVGFPRFDVRGGSRFARIRREVMKRLLPYWLLARGRLTRYSMDEGKSREH